MPWFRGNLHCHSSRSDGSASPEDVARYYKFQGFDFLGLSDHNLYTPVERWAPSGGLLGVPCCEYSGEARCHVLAVGVRENIRPPASRRRKPRAKQRIIQEGIDLTLAAGGVPVVCHPAWEWTLDFDDLINLRNFTHFEICNASPDCNSHPIPGFEPLDNLWDRLLSAGRRCYGVANDDAHDYFRPYGARRALGGRGYSIFKAKRLTLPNILQALREGHFYATTGVELAQYKVTRKAIYLAVDARENERTVIQFFGVDGRELKRSFSSEAAYEFAGDELYVRARIASTTGLWAWTQPLFLDNLAPAIRWSAQM